MQIRQHQKPARGITMILAVLILSAVVAIGITVSVVVVTQVRTNEIVTSTHEGYYASESGLEQGLYTVQKLRTSGESLTSTLTTLHTLTLPNQPSGNAIYTENQPFFTGDSKLEKSVAQTSAGETLPELKENQSVYVEMYDVDKSLDPLSAAPTLTVKAKSADGVKDEVLEVSWVAWSTNLQISRSQRVVVSYTAFNTDPGASIPLTQFYPAFNYTGTLAGFRIRITPLKPIGGVEGASGDVQNFTATVTPTTTSQIQLKSVSSGKSQKQALVATFPWTLPLSSLFDFVIFSERTLSKSIALTMSEEVKTYGPYTPPADTINGGPAAPSANPDPFDSTNCGNCSYYVRIFKDDILIPTVTISMKNNGVAAGAAQTFIIPAGVASCVTPVPFGIFTSAVGDTHTIKFTTVTHITNYQLLTQASFISPEETYCPSS
jgi:hypothetical protein